MFRLLRTRLINAARNFRHHRGGFAAVEFAMVVPVMIVMFIGTVEMSEAYTLARRIVTISGSVADLVTQSSSVSDDDLNDIMRIADSLLAGYDPSRLKITIVSIVADNRGNPLVDWSYDKTRASPLAQGTPYTGLPAGLIGPNQSVVVAKVEYRYTPPIGKNLLGSVLLKEEFHLQPRQSASVQKV